MPLLLGVGAGFALGWYTAGAGDQLATAIKWSAFAAVVVVGYGVARRLELI